jgi:hypothetical protein
MAGKQPHCSGWPRGGTHDESPEKNQFSGSTAGRRRKSSAASAKQKAKAAPRAVPKAKAKSLPRCEKLACYQAFEKTLTTVLFAPTKIMLHTILESVRSRGIAVWEEERFMKYFFQQYVHQETSEALRQDPDTMEGHIWAARWWMGVSSPLTLGHPPSQQPSEQWNKKCKNDLRSVQKMRSHQDVVVGLMKAAAGWLQEVSAEEAAQSDRVVSLLAPAQNLHLEYPDSADGWMLGSKPHMVKKPFTRFNFGFLPIASLIRRFSDRHGCLQCMNTPSCSYYCMPLSKPQPLPAQTVQRMVAVLKARKVAAIRQLLEADGILERTDHAGAPLRFNREKYAETWHTFCVLKVQDREVKFCTCWLFLWRGSCNHRWALQQHLGLGKYTEDRIPDCKVARKQQFARGSSDDECPDRNAKAARVR